MRRTLTVEACAKVNLALEVLDCRPDGYHNIESVALCVGLWDRLELEVADGGSEITVTAEDGDAPSGPENTVYRAAEGFRLAAGLDLTIRARITKQIPTQAGLGGGSSDAAKTLRTLNDLSGAPLDLDQLITIGAEIGSDVPLFLTGGAVLVQGRGEKVTALRDAPRFWFVIAKPDYGVSTREAYSALEAMSDRGWNGVTQAVASAVRAGDAMGITGALWNDFEGPVFEMHPDLRELKMRLIDLGASGALLCGSGSAVFGVFTSRTLAESAWQTIAAEGWQAWRVPSLTRGESLAP